MSDIDDRSRPNDPVRLITLWPAMRVHRAGCWDADRALALGRDSGTRTNVDAATIDSGADVDAVLDAIASDLTDSGDWDRPWTAGDFSLAPCVRDAAKARARRRVPPGRCPGSGGPFAVAITARSGGGFVGRRLYAPCPVCRRSFGTGRGVVPAHRRDAR